MITIDVSVSSRQIGPHHIRPRQFGTLVRQIGPGKWAPTDWAPWKMLVWQIGPRENADAAKYASEIIAPKVTKQLYN